MAGVQEITLERDGHDQPWGFRLQGGSDVKMPLSIQRVLVGTPSDGVLKKGDVLLRISKTDTRGLSHQQAADLFTNVGNQISVVIKRTGSGQTHTASTNSTSIAPPSTVPVSGGVALPGMTTLSQGRSQDTLPKTKSGQQHQGTSAPLGLTIQNQPYRTSPLIQPTAYEKLDLGPGSSQHLKMQADYLTGAREAIPFVDSKASEFSMKQKVTGTLQQIQLSSSPPEYSHSPGLMQSQLPAKQYYNNPINLYSVENVAEVAKLNEMGVSGLPGATCASPTGLLNPHRPQQAVFGAPAREYNPKESATWLALQESDPSIDPEKLKNYSTLREHKPIYSEVYEAPKLALDRKAAPPRPAPARISHNNPSEVFHHLDQIEVHTPVKSPVAEFLPSKIYKKVQESPLYSSNPVKSSADSQPSAVQIAALNEQRRPVSLNSTSDVDNMPLYETNSIGGRKRIAQSASFNKLMMDVLGQ